MKRITLIILAVAAVLTGSVSCSKDNATLESAMPPVSMSIIPDFSDGSVYSYSDNGSFFLRVSVTPEKYIDKLLNNDGLICKADFRSVITKATPMTSDFAVVGKITSGSVEEGYMTASFTLSKEEMEKMWEPDYVVSFSVRGMDGSNGFTTAFVPVSWHSRDGGGGDAVELEAVDMGVSVKWANVNMGTKKLYGMGASYVWESQKYFSALEQLNIELQSKHPGYCWRMPSAEEFAELRDNCKAEVVHIGRNPFLKLTSKENNVIFLPGMHIDKEIKWIFIGVGFEPLGTYWTSSPAPAGEIFKQAQSFAFGKTLSDPFIKIPYSIKLMISPSPVIFPFSVRLVYDKIKVIGIYLDKNSIQLDLGSDAVLVASVNPSNAPDKSVVWSSSNPDVASVDAQGKVTAVSVGEAIITAKTNDGGYTDTCKVTVILPSIDLGLSVKWASMNLGTSALEASGDYYAWGATAPNPGGDYSWAKCPYCIDGIGEKFSKYVPMGKMSYWGGGGNPDHKKVLEPGDDAATARLGGKWRTPTSAEFEELFKSCDTEWTTVNNVNGLKFTSKTNGNSIFLPATGHRDGYNLVDAGEEGLYMSSSLATDIPDHAMSFEIRSEYASTIAKKRNMGLTIRAVTE